ncbi:serpentine type 7TM GPCR chemoreceptor srt domain-containing protein [Ditylenchus destructor]|nr:serpentine type 7TM GPCR chemoreceptor srt domain-containing protein [Ditylenchus destructor]
MMFFHGLETGVYCFTGEVFCSNPHFNYVTGCCGAALFAMETSANFFLAIDRCADCTSPVISKFFFSKNRTWIWTGFSTIFALYYFLFLTPATYNGIFMNWFMNPYYGYNVEIDFNKMLIQVAIITGLNISCFLLYTIMQHLPLSKTLIVIGYYINYFMFGFPPIIYLIFNATIRKDCRKKLQDILYSIGVRMINMSDNRNTSLDMQLTTTIVKPKQSFRVQNKGETTKEFKNKDEITFRQRL